MASGKARVLDWFARGELLRPDWTQATTVHLSRALARSCGAEPPRLRSKALDAATARIEATIGKPQHLVFVLLDACGSSLLDGLDETSFLRRHHKLELRSVFPSATSAALTSLATGTWPAAHGISGWWQYLPRQNRVFVPLPFCELIPKAAGEAQEVTASEVLPLPSVFSASTRRNTAYFPASFKDSTYSSYTAGNAVRFGYEGVETLFSDLAAQVRSSTTPSFTYAYLPHIDALSHEKGPSHASVHELTKTLDTALSELRDALPYDARIVVSADHGQVDIAEAAHEFVRDDSPLLAYLRAPLSGEPTVPMFHLQPGQERAFVEAFAQLYGEHWALLTRDEAFALELFGPAELGQPHVERIGDFIALSREIRHIEYGAKGVAGHYVSGTHGGLRRNEVTVPLVVA